MITPGNAPLETRLGINRASIVNILFPARNIFYPKHQKNENRERTCASFLFIIVISGESPVKAVPYKTVKIFTLLVFEVLTARHAPYFGPGSNRGGMPWVRESVLRPTLSFRTLGIPHQKCHFGQSLFPSRIGRKFLLTGKSGLL
jgi:hypothetical protein